MTLFNYQLKSYLLFSIIKLFDQIIFFFVKILNLLSIKMIIFYFCRPFYTHFCVSQYAKMKNKKKMNTFYESHTKKCVIIKIIFFLRQLLHCIFVPVVGCNLFATLVLSYSNSNVDCDNKFVVLYV